MSVAEHVYIQILNQLAQVPPPPPGAGGQRIPGGRPSGLPTELFLSIFVVLLLVGLLVVSIWVARRQMKQWELPEEEVAFSLDQLRSMHKDGTLTDEEYKKAKAQIIAQSDAMLDKRAALIAEQAQPRQTLQARLKTELNDAIRDTSAPGTIPENSAESDVSEASPEPNDELVDFELDEQDDDKPIDGNIDRNDPR